MCQAFYYINEQNEQLEDYDVVAHYLAVSLLGR